MKVTAGFIVSLLSLAQAQTFPASACARITPAPSDYRCSERGSHPAPGPTDVKVFFNQDAADETQCGNLCLRHGYGQFRPDEDENVGFGCQSFAYNDTSKLCHVFTRSADQIGFVADAGSDTTFTDYFCFNCSAICPHASRTNLLDDSGFELSGRFAGAWHTDNFNLSSNGYESATAGLVHLNTAKGSKDEQQIGLLEQSYIGCPSTLYHFSFKYKIDQYEDAGVHLNIQAGDLSLGVPQESLTIDGTWTTFSDFALRMFEDPNPSLEYLELEYVSEVTAGSGPKSSINATTDNARVVPVAQPPSPAPGASNFFQNGGFESGHLLPGWTATIGPVVTQGNTTYHGASYKIVHPGLTVDGGPAGQAYSLRYIDSGKTPLGAPGFNELALAQKLTGLKMGNVYMVQFSYNATSLFTADISLGPNWSLRANLCGGSGACSGVYSRPLVARNTTISFRLSGYFSSFRRDTFVLDNFSLREVA